MKPDLDNMSETERQQRRARAYENRMEAARIAHEPQHNAHVRDWRLWNEYNMRAVRVYCSFDQWRNAVRAFS